MKTQLMSLDVGLYVHMLDHTKRMHTHVCTHTHTHAQTHTERQREREIENSIL